MQLEAFLAQSPDARPLRDHLTAGALAADMARRSVIEPGKEHSTTETLYEHLTTAIRELEAARAWLPTA